MSHVGVFFDEKLCQEIPEIDVIFGSHTHHYFENGEFNNGVLMAAAGKYGHFLGEVNLTIEHGKVSDKKRNYILLMRYHKLKRTLKKKVKLY